jgi:hypothetical protein
MKKYISAAIVILLTAAITKGQDPKVMVSGANANGGYLGFGIGPSIPVSDYASNDINSDKSGLAKTGYNANIHFAYRQGNHFGLAGSLFTNSNSIDENALKTAFSGFPVKSITTTAWKSSGFLIGLYISSPGKITFEMRVMAGYSSNKSTSTNVEVIDVNGMIGTLSQAAVTTGSFCFDIGPGLKIKLNNTLSLVSYADYYSTTPEFKSIVTSINGAPYSSQDYTQPYRAINITTGIAFNLN